jgi:hypothetical protein
LSLIAACKARAICGTANFFRSQSSHILAIVFPRNKVCLKQKSRLFRLAAFISMGVGAKRKTSREVPLR